MADVLFVCVREDIARAEALAEMFHAAGFSVGDSSFNMSANGACIVLWSAAAVRSRAFRVAAEQALRVPNTVIATLGAPPRPLERSTVATFDLTGWNGDPEDALLDPLFFFVERLVEDARAQELLSFGRSEPITIDADFEDVAAEGDVIVLDAPPVPNVPPHRAALAREVLVQRWEQGRREIRHAHAMRAFACIALLGGAAMFASLNVVASAGANDQERQAAGVVSMPGSKLGGVSFSDIVESAPEDAPYEVIVPDMVETFGVAGLEPPSAEAVSRNESRRRT